MTQDKPRVNIVSMDKLRDEYSPWLPVQYTGIIVASASVIGAINCFSVLPFIDLNKR